MSFRMLIETATLISAHASDVIHDREAIADDALYRYWRNARQCHDYWISRLKPSWNTLFEEQDPTVDDLNHAPAPDLSMKSNHDANARGELSSDLMQRIDVYRDIFASEVLVRVWTAILIAHDSVQRDKQTAPIARNVLISQLQLRRIALEQLVSDFSAIEDDDLKAKLQEVDAFRRRCERWSDLLLGHLLYQFPVEEFAFDVERARDFGEEHLQERFRNSEHVIWQLIRGGARLAFPDSQPRSDRERDITTRFVEGLLGGFPRRSFNAFGGLQALGIGKYTRASKPIEGGMNDEFLKSLPVLRVSEKNPSSSAHEFPSGPVTRFFD